MEGASEMKTRPPDVTENRFLPLFSRQETVFPEKIPSPPPMEYPGGTTYGN